MSWSTAQMGRGPSGEAAPCQKAERRRTRVLTSEDLFSLPNGTRREGKGTVRPVRMHSSRMISLPDPIKSRRRISYCGCVRKVAWMTFQIWPRVGASGLVQWNEIPGALRVRAQGLLSLSGISLADSSQETSV